MSQIPTPLNKTCKNNTFRVKGRRNGIRLYETLSSVVFCSSNEVVNPSIGIQDAMEGTCRSHSALTVLSQCCPSDHIYRHRQLQIWRLRLRVRGSGPNTAPWIQLPLQQHRYTLHIMWCQSKSILRLSQAWYRGVQKEAVKANTP